MSTERRDRGFKQACYEAAGVRWYLLAGPERDGVEVLELHDGRFRVSDAGTMELHPGCHVRRPSLPA